MSHENNDWKHSSLSGNGRRVSPVERLGNHSLHKHVNMIGDALRHTKGT